MLKCLSRTIGGFVVEEEEWSGTNVSGTTKNKIKIAKESLISRRLNTRFFQGLRIDSTLKDPVWSLQKCDLSMNL